MGTLACQTQRAFLKPELDSSGDASCIVDFDRQTPGTGRMP
jgi:hypothetical protein